MSPCSPKPTASARVIDTNAFPWNAGGNSACTELDAWLGPELGAAEIPNDDAMEGEATLLGVVEAAAGGVAAAAAVAPAEEGLPTVWPPDSCHCCAGSCSAPVSPCFAPNTRCASVAAAGPPLLSSWCNEAAWECARCSCGVGSARAKCNSRGSDSAPVPSKSHVNPGPPCTRPHSNTRVSMTTSSLSSAYNSRDCCAGG
eukprot:1142473-Pelagomonas_calceolata.AAC.2